MSIFKKIWAWLSNALTHAEHDALPIAISVTEHVKTALESGTANFLVELVDSITRTGVAAEIVGLVQRNIPRLLALELALSHPPTDATEEEIKNFEDAVLLAIGGKNLVEKSKIWTTLAAQTLGIIRAHLGTASGQTFAGWVQAVEEVYQDYKADEAANG